LAFKAHFTDVDLPAGLMPLLAFPGGYGGIVQTDHGRTSLSCCIRRDVLQRRRAQQPGRAADAVFAYILDHCVGARRTLVGAHIDGPWLAAGPIRPGLRPLHRDGIFAVGNVAGEAHPIVAEGISMALQAASTLAEVLIAHHHDVLRGAFHRAADLYADSWRRSFVARVRAAALFAEVAMRPRASKLIGSLLQRAPTLITLGARWSGKAYPSVRADDASLGAGHRATSTNLRSDRARRVAG
jgi:flavin-dependent dehydrogenase